MISKKMDAVDTDSKKSDHNRFICYINSKKARNVLISISPNPNKPELNISHRL
jgi:hypothetical protein